MAEKTQEPPDYSQWLIEILPRHQRLTAGAQSLLENMLKKERIDFLSVTGRTKTTEGALEKIRRKEYRSPEQQLTDLSGIRVITYLEEQVDQISEVIRELFDIDEKNSLDRTEILGDDRVGYRSTHFVCTLGKKRAELPEYEAIGSLKFEVQVRTVLQHAWAELAHDRSFKFGAALPTKIQRKLNLYSGML
ncbi:MAG: RelA/SpoT domain-containing protein [Xanthobacteraceae bacterium]